MTNKEFKALKAELTRKARIIVIQRRPWCTVVAEVEHNDQRYVDFGHSKANWPDWYSTKRGKEIALGRAIEGIARRITSNVPILMVPGYPEFYVDYVLSAPMSSPPPEDELQRWAYHPLISATGS